MQSNEHIFLTTGRRLIPRELPSLLLLIGPKAIDSQSIKIKLRVKSEE
jgi:hypothetical protein